MKNNILSVITFLLLVLLGTSVEAQKKNADNKAVRIIAQRGDSTVSLRWAPTSPERL
jgi:hypothetical protein